ncbi:MAG: helix-turn-helix domain-containing protein [Pseudobdellovibrionaceae bacterium]
MNDINSQKIKNVFKDLLKKKGITYEEVAEQLDCSLPTVNRILGPEEITLSRVLELCEILDMSFSDLAAMTKEDIQKEERFTEEQESFLAKNGHLFAYFIKLLGKETPKQIAEEYGLNQRSTDKYLIALEKEGLIKVSNKNKVRTVFESMPRLGRGPLGRTYYERIIGAGSRFFINPVRKSIQNSPNGTAAQVTVNASKLTKTSYAKFVEEQGRLLNHYVEISKLEEKIKKPSELMTVVMMTGHTLTNNEDKELKTLDNIFGEIRNI